MTEKAKANQEAHKNEASERYFSHIENQDSLEFMRIEKSFEAGFDRGWQAAIASREPLPPVDGDLLPPIGSKVEIYLASIDAWVEHEVVGYYAWPVFEEHLRKSYHRVCVRVVDETGMLNARMLGDIRPVQRHHDIVKPA